MAKTTDLTKGNINKLLLGFAFPTLISNLFQQFYNLADTAIAGHILGDNALVAIGATSSLFSLIMTFANGLSGGFGIIIAREFGAKNESKVKSAVAHSLSINIIIGAVIFLLSLVVTKPILTAMNTPAAQFGDAYRYIIVILCTVAVPMIYNLEATILRSVGDSKTPLYFLIFASIMNIILDWVFMKNLDMGVTGAAVATVVSQLSASLLCLIVIKKNFPVLHITKSDFARDKKLTSDMLSAGMTMATMNSIFSIGSIIMQGAINALGETIIAAHLASRKLAEMFMQPLVTVGLACSTFVSQNFGAKKYDRMRHYVAMSIYLMVAFAVAMTIGFEIANRPIMHLMNYSEEIMPDVTSYMGIIYAGLIVTAAYNALAAFLRALGDSKSPLYFLIISAAINVLLDIVFIIYVGMGVEGCAYATVIAQAISAILCLIYIVKKFPILHLKKENFTVSFQELGKLLALGIPMALQFSITAIGVIVVQGAINVYGENYMAGFSAAGKLQNIFSTVFVAFGATIATYVGQNRGAGKMDRVKQGVRCTQLMIFVYSIFAMLVLYFLGRHMALLFIDASETQVLDVAETYFHTVFWCYPFLGSIFLYRNALQGLGYGLVPMVGGIFELVARTGIIMLVAGHTSFAGVCLADPAAWISALIPLIPYYIYTMRKWEKQRTVKMTAN